MAKVVRQKPRGRATTAIPAPAEPRRHPQQERGERRVEEILDAAAAVIAELGVEAATTNAIAERAEASVGSLYHFFPNKEAIIRGLAARYEAELRAVNQASMSPAAVAQSIPEMVEGIVTPLNQFMEQHPAYMPVFYASVDPRQPSCLTVQLRETIVALVEQLMAARAPAIAPATRRIHAKVAVEMVHRMLEFAWVSPAAERPAIVRELKRLLALQTEMIESGRDPLAI